MAAYRCSKCCRSLLRSGLRAPAGPALRLASPVRRRYYSTDHEDEPSSIKDRLVYPEPASSQHSDLASFLAYVQRSGLDDKSTVYVGTHYEYTIANTLSRLGFSLRRIGGSSDYGTDLLGTWQPPSTSLSLRVLVQCKAGSQRSGPNYIRELEGAFAGAPAGWRGSGVMALLVSENAATKGVRESMGRSRLPLGYVCSSKEGVVRQLLWNRRAQEVGLEGVDVVARHSEDGESLGIALRHNGRLLPIPDGLKG